MPDLRTEPVTEWLRTAFYLEMVPPSPPPIRAVEDDPAVSKGLERLGDRLERAIGNDMPLAAIFTPETIEELQTIMAQLGSARNARLLCWLLDREEAARAREEEPAQPAVANRLFQGVSPAAVTLRAVLDSAIQKAAIQNIFSPERRQEMVTVLAALNKAAER
jgi:hypothetical protein